MAAETGCGAQGASRADRQVAALAELDAGLGERSADLPGDLVFAEDDGIEAGRYRGEPLEGLDAAVLYRCIAVAVPEAEGLEPLAACHDGVVPVGGIHGGAYGRHVGRPERDGTPGAHAKGSQGVSQPHKVD